MNKLRLMFKICEQEYQDTGDNKKPVEKKAREPRAGYTLHQNLTRRQLRNAIDDD